jgi:hypothetical protein
MEEALVQGCTRTREHSNNRRPNLTSLSDRIAAFIVDQFPSDGSPVELLNVDHNGTYVILFLATASRTPGAILRRTKLSRLTWQAGV